MTENNDRQARTVGSAFLHINPVGTELHLTGFTDPHGNYTAYEPTEKIGDLP